MGQKISKTVYVLFVVVSSTIALTLSAQLFLLPFAAICSYSLSLSSHLCLSSDSRVPIAGDLDLSLTNADWFGWFGLYLKYLPNVLSISPYHNKCMDKMHKHSSGQKFVLYCSLDIHFYVHVCVYSNSLV